MRNPLALVTGVIGGIGYAIAQRLANDGINVVITDIESSELNSKAKELNLPMIAADLSEPISVEELKIKMIQDYGHPNIIVNAAGGVCNQVANDLENVTTEQWDQIFQSNVDSAFYISRAFVAGMKKNNWGRIVTISSGAGLRPSLTGIQAYTAAKHALVGLTKQLSSELGKYGITINSIAPGFILSNPTTQKQWDSYGEKGQSELINRIHTRRLGKPEDVASIIAFLTSKEANWISGQIISVDGGIS